MSDLEDYDCPLCMEELDFSERNFKPCPCGYQICRFCWHHIKEELNGKCPACRRAYSDENVQFTPVTSTELSRIKTEKKAKEREKKEIESMSRKHLANVRVVQKNLIYVIGLTAKVTEEVLRSSDYFGQYGKITKVVINRRHAQNSTSTHPGQTPTVGVYITYARREDSAKAISAVDGSMSDGRILRATYGTTKYCTYYLRNMPCQNPNCMYLHEPGEEADTFTREDLASGRHNLKDHHAQMEHSSPKPQILGTHAHSPELSSFEPSNSSPQSPETPVAIYRSESKSNDGDNEGSALPATASWAKLATNKSKLSTVKSPLLSLDQFPPPPAAARPKAKVISLSKKSQSDQKSRTSSDEGDGDGKKPQEVGPPGKCTAGTGSKITTGNNTPVLSSSPESVTQETQIHSKQAEVEVDTQKEVSARAAAPETSVLEEHVSTNDQTQVVEATQQPEQSLIDEERLHQEVMAELERERSAFYQQQPRTNVSLPPGLMETFPFNPISLSANTYKGGFDPFGSENNKERDGRDSLLSSMQNMHIRNSYSTQSEVDPNRPFGSFAVDEFSQNPQYQKQNLESNNTQPVQNSRPKLYSRFGFALNEEEDFGSIQSRMSSINHIAPQPSGLFDPFGRSAPNHAPDQDNVRGMFPTHLSNFSTQSKEEISHRAMSHRGDGRGLVTGGQEWGAHQHPSSPFASQNPMQFAAQSPIRSMPPGMAPPPGYASGYSGRAFNPMGGYGYEERPDAAFPSYSGRIPDHERSPTRHLHQNPNLPFRSEPQTYGMDMFDRNLRRIPDSQPPGLGQYDAQFASEQTDFFSNFLRAAAEKRNAAANGESGHYRDPRAHFEDPAIMSARVSSPPNSADLSEKMDPRNWNGNANFHRLRGYDVDFKLDNGELGQFQVS